MDLRFEFDSIGCRRLWALLSGLPVDAAIRRDGKQWTTERELAARQVESSAGLLRLIAQALGVKFKGDAPGLIEHPDRVTSDTARESAAPTRMSTRDEIGAFFGRLTRR